jgi:hypothetical protein
MGGQKNLSGDWVEAAILMPKKLRDLQSFNLAEGCVEVVMCYFIVQRHSFESFTCSKVEDG